MHGLKYRYFIPILFIGLALFLLYEIESFYSSTDQRKRELLTDSRRNVTMLIQREKDTVHAIAIQLTTDRHIIDMYKKDQRDLLYHHLLPFWEGLKEKHLIHEMHFFKKPARSYVNMSNIGAFNIDVSDVRSDIAWVTSSFQESSHLMVCKTYSGIRATYPIMDGKTVLGGVSVGKNMDTLPETFKELTGNNAFITYFDNRLRNHLKPEIYHKYIEGKQKVGDKYLTVTTLPLETETLSPLTFDKGGEFIDRDEKKYFLTHVPLYDFDGNLIGYFTTLHDFTYYYEDFKGHLLKELILFLIVGLAIYLTITGTTNKVLHEIRLIDQLANRLKKNDFSILEGQAEHISYDEIDHLRDTVFAMGKQIKNYIENLESLVAKKTEEVWALNWDLQSRVKEEVEANLQKDKLLFMQQNMAAKGELMSMIAHHWRQPLTSIGLLIQDLQDAFEYNELDKTYMNKTTRDALVLLQNLSDTIDNFRTLFHETDQTAPLSQVIGETVSMMEPVLLQQHITLVVHDPADLGKHLIPSELSNALIPILNNATESIIRSKTDKGKIDIILQKEGTTLSLEIRDNGDGIDPAIKEQIFEPYFSTKTSRNETGLGLFMAKMIVTQKLGGSLDITEVKEGACFTITFS